MAQPTGTFSTSDSVGNREELMDMIFNISPEDTPFASLIGRESCKTTHPEWQTDTLATPVTTNAQIEGADYTYTEKDPTTRVGNYTQISTKDVIVTKTQEVTDKAGRKSEVAFQLAKAGKELRKDMEASLLANNASVAGNDTTARELGGFAAWLTTNADRGGSGADGGFNSGTGIVDAATNGTQRAFSKAILDGLLEDVYEAGGDARHLILSPYLKGVFVTFMSDTNVASFRYAASGSGKNTIVATADIYEGAHGKVTVMPNRVMSAVGASLARNAFLVDRNMAKLKVLRPIKTEKPAQTGDSIKRVLITEYTLCVKNEAAHGVAADLYGMTASS